MSMLYLSQNIDGNVENVFYFGSEIQIESIDNSLDLAGDSRPLMPLNKLGRRACETWSNIRYQSK